MITLQYNYKIDYLFICESRGSILKKHVPALLMSFNKVRCVISAISGTCMTASRCKRLNKANRLEWSSAGNLFYILIVIIIVYLSCYLVKFFRNLMSFLWYLYCWPVSSPQLWCICFPIGIELSPHRRFIIIYLRYWIPLRNLSIKISEGVRKSNNYVNECKILSCKLLVLDTISDPLHPLTLFISKASHHGPDYNAANNINRQSSFYDAHVQVGA